MVVCNTAKVRFFKQITTIYKGHTHTAKLFAIQQKYDFSSKSQLFLCQNKCSVCCLQYCKSTIFQANHNYYNSYLYLYYVVCNTAKVRFFKQITTNCEVTAAIMALFAIQQKYDFSSKSQRETMEGIVNFGCLQYSKSTIFQANHNAFNQRLTGRNVVCNTAKVRFFKQITTLCVILVHIIELFAIQQKYDFSSKSQPINLSLMFYLVVCNTAKVRFFKQITTAYERELALFQLFAIQQKYDFSSKSQLSILRLVL